MLNTVAAVLTILYPAAVYFGLQWFEPRLLCLLLVVILMLRHLGRLHQLLTSLQRSEWLALATLTAMVITIVLFNNEILLRLYPASVSLLMLFIFARTLINPPSIIERFARQSFPDLPPAGVLYTRRVTAVWCLFFIANSSIAFASAFASREWWLLYNGLISYLLMGSLFIGEWLVRRRVLPRKAPTA